MRDAVYSRFNRPSSILVPDPGSTVQDLFALYLLWYSSHIESISKMIVVNGTGEHQMNALEVPYERIVP